MIVATFVVVLVSGKYIHYNFSLTIPPDQFVFFVLSFLFNNSVVLSYRGDVGKTSICALLVGASLMDKSEVYTSGVILFGSFDGK